MTISYHTQRKSQKKPLGRRLLPWLVLAVVVFAVGLGIGLFRTAEPPETESPAPAPVEQQTRDVTLYFASADGQSLIAESRVINECEREEDCLQDTVRALIAGPQGELAPIFSPQVAVRGVSIADSLASIDFTQDLVATHPGGTQSELLTVYGLADTVKVNFPHLSQVQILVDGTAIETLKGHVDLRQPVNPDFSLVEEGPVPIGNVGEQSEGNND